LREQREAIWHHVSTVDWTVVEEADHYTGTQWADIRGVTEDAVRSNVNSAREKLLAEADRDPVE
jgi:DNA-directed RNA polymerase specialized sigma24 family protein